jgi:hypothetical protein
VQGRRRWVRLHEKGGKEHDVPCHHNLDHYGVPIAGGQKPTLSQTGSDGLSGIFRESLTSDHLNN